MEKAKTDLREIERIEPQEVEELRLQGADLVVVDVRSPESFRQRRVPGAVSIPKEVLHERFEALDPGQHIVFY